MKHALDAIHRRKDYISNIKDAIPPQTFKIALQAIPDNHNGLMVRTAILFMFYGTLRQSEVAPPTIAKFDPLLHLTQADVLLTDFVTLTIKAGKNLQKYNQKKVVTLAPTSIPINCPVQAVKDVYNATQNAQPGDPFLVFPDLTTSIPTSYLRAEWARTMSRVGADHTKFSLHSLRKASTTVAHSGGCSELEVQRHGGWASGAYRTYIQTDTDNVTNVLSHSLN